MRASSGLGRIVALALAMGFLAALLVPPCPFIPVEESALTGTVLCGFAVGWAALFLLTVRFAAHPQRWAAVPAVFMGVSGLLLVVFGSPVREGLTWVWPPALLALVVWMLRRTRRGLPNRGGRVQLYVVFGVLALAAVGGGYQAVGEATDPTPYLQPAG